MKTRRSRRIGGLVAFLLGTTLVLTGCSASPPDNLDKAAGALSGQIGDARKAVDKAQTDFKTKLGQPSYTFIAGYTPIQQHADRFDAARTKLNEADKAYKDEVKPLVDDYADSKKTALEAAIAKVNKLKGDAQTLTADPSLWLDKVAAVKANPDQTVRDAATSLSGMKTVYDPLNGDVETAKKTYVKNASVIDQKFQPFATEYSGALQANGLLEAESKKPSPNYAVMAEQATTVQNNATAFKKDVPAFKGKLAGLDVRESHTLVDIRVDSTVEISRTTWNDSYDFPDEHDFDYPEVPVDLDTANYFAKFSGDDVLAKDSTAWLGGGFKTDKASKEMWNKLHINTRDPKWSGSDDTAEFYLGEIDDTYCHKLRVLKDGKPDISGKPADGDNPCAKYNTQADLDQGTYWLEADDLDADAIGMDIYAKGLGEFDDQADQEASPPGMVYVGDTDTGEWKTDSNGNSFWAFYGQYRFFSDLIGGPYPYHYRYEYDEWNRSYRHAGHPYYSTMSGKPRYGSKSPLVSSRFPRSTFVTSGLQNMTVRNAGPAARAGGPGGGGK